MVIRSEINVRSPAKDIHFDIFLLLRRNTYAAHVKSLLASALVIIADFF